MDFIKVVQEVCGGLETGEVEYAIIGGLAMALQGVQRSTLDLDLLILARDLDKTDALLTSLGYIREFHNQNVSHYQHGDASFGRIDFLHARRSSTQTLLKSCDQIPYLNNAKVNVVRVEGLIGLKVQALVNDPDRELSDLSDIKLLCEQCAFAQKPLDWVEVESYLALFDKQDLLIDFRNWYDSQR